MVFCLQRWMFTCFNPPLWLSMPCTYLLKVFNLQWCLLQPPCRPYAPSVFNYFSNAPLWLFCLLCCVKMTLSVIHSVYFFFFCTSLHSCSSNSNWRQNESNSCSLHLHNLAACMAMFFSAQHHKLSIKMHPERILKIALRSINALDVFMHRL